MNERTNERTAWIHSRLIIIEIHIFIYFLSSISFLSFYILQFSSRHQFGFLVVVEISTEKKSNTYHFLFSGIFSSYSDHLYSVVYVAVYVVASYLIR